MTHLTSRGAEFRVEIARGEVPLAELQALSGCTRASLDPAGALVVHFTGSPEEIITRVVGLLISRGVLILGVTRGRKLEDRVLQVT